MKCVKSNTGEIARVSDQLAQERVASGSWSYCGKEEWKKQEKDKK